MHMAKLYHCSIDGIDVQTRSLRSQDTAMEKAQVPNDFFQPTYFTVLVQHTLHCVLQEVESNFCVE